MSCISAFQPTSSYLSTVVYNGNGATTSFQYTFDYLNKDVWAANNPDTASTSYNPYLRVYVDGTLTAYRMTNATTIVLSTAPASGTSNVVIRRDSKIDSRAVDYTEGSVLTETNLDRDSKQAFFLIQELHDRALDLQCRTDGRFVNSYLFTSTSGQTNYDLNTTSSSTGLTQETLLLNREEVLVYLNGTLQQARAANYSTSLVSGVLRVTLASAPALATSVEIRTLVSGVSQSVNLANDAVTTAKIANGAVTWTKTNFNGAGSNGTFLKQSGGVATWGTIANSDVTGLNSAITNKRLDEFAAPTTVGALNSQRIINLATPVASTDAATKGYIDSLVAVTYVPQVKLTTSLTVYNSDVTVTCPFAWDFLRIEPIHVSIPNRTHGSTNYDWLYGYNEISTNAAARTSIQFNTSNHSISAYRSGNNFVHKANSSGAGGKTLVLTFFKNAVGV